ncbi:ABC transporter substrate-binding protein [Pseudooceanicola sp. LIPI14-2-Ac024]|uniref:ABC transporter substrate-binding protein n=1 Tax=Pseudooceanicola sp. LIPI14-2-Ac024 TaxID=3344875 RepID=UPI0035CFC397
MKPTTKRRTITCVSSAVTLAVLAIAGPALAQEKVKGGTATVAIETEPNGFEPLEGRIFGQTGSTVALAIEEPLLRWNYNTGEPEALLATEWSVNDDQTVWTLKLREGVKFHDGTDFDAGDVAFHYNRLIDPENKFAGRTGIAAIKEVKAIDDLTVEFHLNHPWSAFLPAMADLGMSGPIPSPEQIEKGEQNRSPVGTGPFKFVEWASGDRIVVEKNPEYWDADSINLDKIVFRVLPDTQTRYASLQSGQVDAIWTDRGPTIVEAQNDPKVVSMFADGAGAATILLNDKMPPFDDPNVRAAIAHGWNQEALVKISFRDTRPSVTHPLGPQKDCGEAGYRAFDQAKAKEYVAAYGKPIEFNFINTTTPRGRELGELMQQLMKGIGITVNLEPVDQTTLVKRVLSRDYQMSGWRFADDVDMGPSLIATGKSDSNYNLTGMNIPELDKIAVELESLTDREKSLEMQCDMIELMNQDASILYMGGGRYWAFTSPRLKGVDKPWGGIIDVTRAWVEN